VALGVSATPTLLINDLLVVGTPGISRINAFVTSALRARQGSTEVIR
jgi:protein-disulfide isomerase